MASEPQAKGNPYNSKAEVINHPDRIIIDGRVKFPVRMVTHESRMNLMISLLKCMLIENIVPKNNYKMCWQ